jgi:hypothetical protein
MNTCSFVPDLMTDVKLPGKQRDRAASLSAAPALVEARGGLTLAYDTDWPTSLRMTALSGLVYLLSLAPVSGRNEAPIGLELPQRFLLEGLVSCYRLEIA